MPSSSELRDLLDSYELAMRAEHKAARTLQGYREGCQQFITWLENHHGSVSAADVTAAQLRGFLAELLETRKPATARNRYSALRQFFNWMAAEGEIPQSPMANMAPPAVTAPTIQVLTPEQLRRLLAACSGRDFVARRDTAIIRLFIDTGLRRTELANLTLDDVNLRETTVRVIGKGRRPRIVPFGVRTAQAIDRYLRERRKHLHSHSSRLWLGEKNKPTLGSDGIRQMLERRGNLIGIHLHAHQFRHTFAAAWLAEGGTEGDLMKIGGWRSRQMLDRYGAANAEQRARDAHRRLGLGDRL